MDDDLTCRECGEPVVVNADGTANHVLPVDTGGIDDVDYDRDADHVAIPEEED